MQNVHVVPELVYRGVIVSVDEKGGFTASYAGIRLRQETYIGLKARINIVMSDTRLRQENPPVTWREVLVLYVGDLAHEGWAFTMERAYAAEKDGKVRYFFRRINLDPGRVSWLDSTTMPVSDDVKIVPYTARRKRRIIERIMGIEGNG